MYSKSVATAQWINQLLWFIQAWRCHKMEILSGLLSLCEGNPSVTGVFPFQRANYQEIWKFYLIDQKRLLKWLSNCRSFEKPWRSRSVILLFGTYAKLMMVSNETILNFSTTVVMLLQWIGVVNCWFYIWWRHQMETFPRYWPFVKGSTGHRWITSTKASDAKLWCFLWSAHEQTVKLTLETLVIWEAIALIMTPL